MFALLPRIVPPSASRATRSSQQRLITLLVLLSSLLLIGIARADDYPGAPASVTAAYLEADGAGQAWESRTAPELLHFTTWQQLDKFDGFAVIESYDIGEVGWTGNRADVQITYHVLGFVTGVTFTAKPALKEVFFSLEKSKGRWRIVSPRLRPHLFVPAAISALEKAPASDTPEGRASLRKLRALP